MDKILLCEQMIEKFKKTIEYYDRKVGHLHWDCLIHLPHVIDYDFPFGFCACIRSVLRFQNAESTGFLMRVHLPELFDLKPEGWSKHWPYWFKTNKQGIEERIKLLETIINHIKSKQNEV